MKNRKLFLVASLLLALTISLGGTLAYLTDTDSAVNVMTLGNVDIEQYEKNEAGADFQNDQPLFPAYYPGDVITWGNELVGEIEKYVTVENTGKSDAYARTWVAFEKDSSMIHIKWADGVERTPVSSARIAAEINGEVLVQEYDIYCVTYNDVLKPGKTYAVLDEFAMDKHAGNDYVASFGETYDVLVLTQAVQTTNLTDLGAVAALNEAFTANHPWTEGAEGDVEQNATLEDAIKAVLDRSYAKLTLKTDVEWKTGAEHGSTPLVPEREALQTLIIDGNGKTLTATGAGVGPLRAANGGTITFQNMTIVDKSESYAESSWEFGYLEFAGKLVFENVTFENAVMFEGEEVEFINCTFNSNKDSEYAVWVSDGVATFKNCTFTGPRGLKMHEAYGSEVDTVVVDNCTFMNLTKKPGLAIGTVNADTSVTIKNSKFIGCQPGDQSLYIYETDTDVNSFTFILDNNEVVNEGVVKGTDKAALVNAINEVEAGGTVYLTDDTTIAGYDSGNKLVIDKNVTIDLGGKTLTTECGWGGIDLKGGASIVNGTINHTGNTAAIRAFQVGKIENVIINVTETAGKTKGGIVVQNGDSYIESIKNVTINGATNGIECYRSTKNPAIGSMENVKINATEHGIYLNGAGVLGTISNCDIYGGSHGINAYLANLWHISLDIENSKISGGRYGVDIWDEGATNAGSTISFTYDNKTVFDGGVKDIKVTLQEEIAYTENGVKQTTPIDK